MKTHRERARQAIQRHEETRHRYSLDEDPEDQVNAVALITYPTELVEAAGSMLRIASCDLRHRLVTKGCKCTPCQYADDLRDALALYDDKETE